ncbi:hypothetical protein Tco_0023769 [Tanacetum coccineum]
MTEQQKKRQAEVLESAKYYTEEDYDIIRANSDTSKKQKTTEVKEVPVTEELVKEPTSPKQEEIEQPIKKSGRQKSMARKRKLGQSTAKEDEEYEKEKEELSLFLIIAFYKHSLSY